MGTRFVPKVFPIVSGIMKGNYTRRELELKNGTPPSKITISNRRRHIYRKRFGFRINIDSKPQACAGVMEQKQPKTLRAWVYNGTIMKLLTSFSR
jgi:hypothetical protein